MDVANVNRSFKQKQKEFDIKWERVEILFEFHHYIFHFNFKGLLKEEQF